MSAIELPVDRPDEEGVTDDTRPACVMLFNSNDPCGAGGLAADLTAVASVGAHALPVVTGSYLRDTAQSFDHVAFDDDCVSEQARGVLEDITVQVIKVGFAGSLDNLGAIASVAGDYSQLPVIAYMPDLSWWEQSKIELYHDAFQELLLPLTTVLVGNHSTLRRWLLADWDGDGPPTARDIAKAASEHGVPYTLVTGIALPGQFVDNVLASPQSVLASEKFELFDGSFAGAGDTLSGALAALLASGSDLVTAFSEALHYLDRSLDGGFRPGMGHIVPDRLFWAQPEDAEDAAGDEGEEASGSEASPATDPAAVIEAMALPPHDTRH